jgi:hypothetical protein
MSARTSAVLAACLLVTTAHLAVAEPGSEPSQKPVLIDWDAEPPESAKSQGAETEAAGAAVERQRGASDVSSPVGLDKLLRLPKSFDAKPSRRRGNADEREWKERFSASAAQMAEAESALGTAVSELEEVAGGSGQYSIAPPGANADPTASPVSFRLRQQIRRRREAVEEAERDHRALMIEADLAEVPAQWRTSAPAGERDPASN